ALWPASFRPMPSTSASCPPWSNLDRFSLVSQSVSRPEFTPPGRPLLPIQQEGPTIDIDRNLYAVLGEQTFRALVDAFYRRVESDPQLRPLFPPSLDEGRDKPVLFPIQLFGVP